jgi:pantothenate kinase
MISTYSINPGIPFNGNLVQAVEIPAPKVGSPYPEGLEHAEFVIPSNAGGDPSSAGFDHATVLRNFAREHKGVEWSFKATMKECNPDISVKVDMKDKGVGAATAKFHLVPLPTVIEWEKKSKQREPTSWVVKVAKTVKEEIKGREKGRPYVVGIAGGPGSGKSSASCELASEIGSDAQVLNLPMDGYHKPLKELKTKEEVYRRGSPGTFDEGKLLGDLKRVVEGDEVAVVLPGWDHAVGDPIEGAHTYEREKHDVVIVEGLYLLLPEWGLKGLFDKTIFVKSDIDKCMELLKVRNTCIPGYTKEEIEERVDDVDRANAMLVGERGGEEDADVVVDGYSCM